MRVTQSAICFRYYTFRILALFATVLARFTVDAYCESLPINPKWEDLTRVLDEASEGFVLLCPFEISGSGCPTEPTPYNVESTLDIVCLGQSSTFDECLIECPTTQFVVKQSGVLLFESITIRSAQETPIQVESNGVFSAQGCTFDSNGSLNIRGGAIRGSENSNITIQTSTFDNNLASDGGAIHSSGALTISGSNFRNNSAINNGGAIFTASNSRSLTFTWNSMEKNRAGIQGPAIYIEVLEESSVQQQQQLSFKSNYACGNSLGYGNAMQFCDGIVWNGTRCYAFSDTCGLPTAAPTILPTEKPIPTPTGLNPTKNPTARPSPSSSQDPTASLYQSNEPSQSPRAIITPTPTIGLYTTSQSPQTMVSSTPTSSVTTNNPSESPSTSSPTNKPTFWFQSEIFNITSLTSSPSTTRTDTTTPSTATPSILPSVGPSLPLSSSPSKIPSIVPSTVPSMVPSPLPSTSSSTSPSLVPSASPSVSPSAAPGTTPSFVPTSLPTAIPTHAPSTMVPIKYPTGLPTVRHSVSNVPSTSMQPSFSPNASNRPSLRPSPMPIPSDPPVSLSPTTRAPTFSWVTSIGDILNSTFATFQNNSTNSTTIP